MKINCSLGGCTKPAYGYGWCNLHYARWRRHGDPLYEAQVGYHTKHYRTRNKRGKAQSCLWGCTHTRYEWASMFGSLEDIWDYTQMCKTCHSRYDAALEMMTKDGPWRIRNRPTKGSGPNR